VTIALERINTNLRMIKILDYPIIPSIMDVEEVFLSGFNIPDLCCFSNVKMITVSSKRLYGVSVDVCSLQRLEKLRIRAVSNIMNYDSLVNLQSLAIASCPSITDVSCFQNFPELTLMYCSGITDVSSLGNVRKLDLRFCKNIHDVSALGKAHALNLSNCEKVTTDLSSLKLVHTLCFRRFSGSHFSG
jgi:hypothetical protein